jgi:membrane dipeptidase
LLAGGVTAQVFALFGLSSVRHRAADTPTVEVLRQVDAFYHMVGQTREQFVVATTAGAVEQARAEGKVAGILGMEGTEPLADELGLLRVFHRLGVRVVGLTWNRRNPVGDGVLVADAHGLTDFGRTVVREVFRLGMVLDVAHLAAPGVRDVVKMAEGPVVNSHANAHALCGSPRNLTDAQLDALAATGGVVCATFVPDFIATFPARASLERLLDHIDHIVRRIGVEHVGLGSDFEGYDAVMPGLEDVTCLPTLTAGLAAHGYDEPAIRSILGLNLLRVFRQLAG